MRGFIFWKGPSPIDRAPLVAIATLKSENDKTGDMIQTWILRQDMHPVEARQTGADRSICGDCSIKADCYVDWGKAPTSIWHAFRRDSYVDLRRKPSLIRRLTDGREVRLGAAGDPGMLPMHAWDDLLIRARGWTGYTHLWRESWAQPLRVLVMASVETAADADLARAMGWRTFRVRTKAQPLLRHEIACVNELTGRQCKDCLACDGALKPKAASVAIIVHGKGAKAFERAQA